MPQHILIVDDDEELCAALEALLRRADYTCTSVYTGQGALDFLAEQTPALVLLDITMPDISGFEIARHIRADPRTGLLPIVMLTARLDAESRRKSLLAGANEHITKPLETTALLIRIRKALDSQRNDN